eukprot:TRINITY_DN4339_c0_g1_i9.p2 TRINITY_DN4339_c0_g1~~TRINITY_DN4339_c0_g1_i9.p2  ORF type:complete len:147 (+),score=7.95 TRINITY_DN4339_c0_g1_i9:181-621(+)
MNRQDKTISRLSNINLWPMDDLLKALSPTQHRELVLIYIRSRIKLNQKDYSSTFRSLLPYMLRFSSCSSLGDLLQSALFLLTGVTPEELDVNLTRQIVARKVQVVSSLQVDQPEHSRGDVRWRCKTTWTGILPSRCIFPQFSNGCL